MITQITMNKKVFIVDCNCREILPGDVLKIFHFIGPRRKKYYMYKYVKSIENRSTWGDIDALRIMHLDGTEECSFKIRNNQKWTECEIVQGYGDNGIPFYKRPKLKFEK